MLKKKISVGVLCSMMFFSVGCQSEEDDLDSEYIRQNYENINKDELDYSYS